MEPTGLADDSVAQFETVIHGRVIRPQNEYDPPNPFSKDQNVTPSGRARRRAEQ